MTAVFISSTSQDLLHHREAVDAALRRLDVRPINMKYFGSQSGDAVQVSLREVRKADLLVGIIAHRYGYVPAGMAKSVTEQEYDEAQRLGVPCLMYLVDPAYAWDSTHIEQEASAQEKLQHFKNRLNMRHVRSLFTTPENLAAQVTADVAKWLQSQSGIHTSPADKNRERMLTKVEQFWIKGVLENSLHSAALLELGMAYQPQAVDRAWEMVLQQPEYPDRTLPHGTHILEVYHDLNGELLILGDPGAGKTTTLLELARDLIHRAQHNATHPIPVVFNLSSWAERREPLTAWLVDELNTKYQVPRKVGEQWVKHDKILPLLDGLDEVAFEHRAACVDTINIFRSEHGLNPLVVCSRTADYEALSKRLKLHGAVVLQPLSPAQVDNYLQAAGDDMAGVRAVLNDDDKLSELVTSPLMLSIVTLAYQGKTENELAGFETLESRRQHLFDTYVDRMLTRKGSHAAYTPAQTRHYLAWLATQMSQHAQSVFEIEGLQPGYLERRFLPFYQLSVRFSGGLLIGAIFSSSATLTLIPVHYFFVLAGILEHFEVKSFLITNSEVFIVVLPIAAILYTGVGFLMGSLLMHTHETIKNVEALRWSWEDASNSFVFRLIGTPWVAIGLLFAVIFTLIPYETMNKLIPDSALVWLLFAGSRVLFSLITGITLISILIEGLSNRIVPVKTLPNQGIRSSDKNSQLIFVIVAGVTACAFLSFLFLFFNSFPIALQNVTPIGYFVLVLPILLLILSFSIQAGIMAALNYGLKTVIQHRVLRFLLWRNQAIPRNYAHFLDFAASRILLRKVGGGYMFVHRLLLDYFAQNATLPKTIDHTTNKLGISHGVDDENVGMLKANSGDLSAPNIAKTAQSV